MRGEIVMGKNEQFTFSVIEDYRVGKISRWEASLIVGKSERTVDRLVKRIDEKGLEGLIHGNRGRTPQNKTPAELLIRVESLVKNKYFDFNMTHCREMLFENEEVNLGYNSARVTKPDDSIFVDLGHELTGLGCKA